MASVIIMPKQGLLMEKGTILRWLVQEGQPCMKGKPLFEMETDKLTITMDATDTGTLLKIIHPEGDEVAVTQAIAIVGQPGEDISGLIEEREEQRIPAAAPSAPEETAPNASLPRHAGRKAASPRARLRAEEQGVDLERLVGSGPDGLVVERDLKAYLAAERAATPLAARLAQQRGIALEGVTGTGANGKITAADLPDELTAPEADTADWEQPMSGMRMAIARNMLESQATTAQTNQRMTIDMTAIQALRRQYQELGHKISYTDCMIRCCATALQEMPILNASVKQNNIVYHKAVHVGLAVAVPSGLIVPVIRNAEQMRLEEIAAKSEELIARARENQLRMEEYHGGTFTVSSLGMYDVDDFVAIINPPESAILAVGKIEKKPVVVGDDEIVVRPLCTLCLSYDHRIIDGATAAQFLQKLKRYLQNPALLI